MSLATITGAFPTRERQVTTLRKVYGYTDEQIAERLHLTLPQVQADLAASIRHMADALYPRLR